MLGFSVGAVNDTESQYIKALERLSDIGTKKLFTFWLWPYIIFRFTSYYREGYPCIELFHDLARSAFNKRKKEYLSKNTTDDNAKHKALIDVLLKLHLESQELSEEEAVSEMVSFIVAGFETVSLSATWALFLIGHHPDVQEKVHQELDKVFAEDNDIYATEEDLNQLVYLNSVLMESNRIYTTVPFFGRQANEDIVICGHTIPKGASCFVVSYFLHKDENVFPDPEKFDPDRFSPENSTKIPEGAFVPFSAGPRNCIDLMTVFRRWEERHKKEQIICLWFLYKPIVVFGKADVVKELLKHPKMYEKSTFYEILELLFGRGIVTSPVEKWKPRRKSLNPCFHHDMLKRYLEVFNAYSQTLVNILKIETEKEFCDIRKLITCAALDIVCETMLGFSVGAVNDPESQYIKAFERLTDIGTKRVFTFWLWPDTIFRFTSYYREAYQSIKLFNDLARSAFNKRKKEYLSKNTTDGSAKHKALIDVLLKLHLESQELGEEEAVSEIVSFIVAGFETVSLSATWALFLIGHHPDVQEKIHEELDKVFAEDNDIYATEADLNQLVYLNSVLMESIRIYTTVPFFGREAKEDIVICGHTIPKGASCFVASYFLHKDENVFPDPEKFDPDRFSPENSTKIPEGAFVPFSAGQRNCIGKRYALMELKTIMSYILRNYTVESLDSKDEIVPEMKIELAPSTAIRLRIRPRKISNF